MLPDSIPYLGNIIENGKIAEDRSKLNKIRYWAFPKTGNEMASDIGLCTNFQRLIPHFAEYAETLNKNLLEIKVTSSDALETAFGKLKGERSDGAALGLPCPDKTFVVETDASENAVGAVLIQSEGKSYNLRSSRAKHSMLLNEINPTTNANCWWS